MRILFLALRPLLFLAIGILIINTISRFALVVVFYSRVSEVDAVNFILRQGFRFDLVIIGMALILPMLIFPILASHRFTLIIWRNLMFIYVPIVMASVLFMELTTVPFVEQFDVRPNVIFFEYIGYPKEILSTLWGAYRLQLIVGLVVTLSFGYGVYRLCKLINQPMQPVRWKVAVPALIAIYLTLSLMIRSTFDHRPVNPSTVARTTDTLVNDLPLSSLYTVAYAAYAMKNENSGKLAYGHMSTDKALALVKRDMAIDESLFVSVNSTNRRSIADQRKNRPKNLVILLQESLGAEFVGALGGICVTPNIDALSSEGIWFKQLYATGTRSVRGIEAVMTGFPPTPARSVVKLNRSQTGFFTLASALGDQSYNTSFIYGGESHFDNMRRFFVGNGVQTVIDAH